MAVFKQKYKDGDFTAMLNMTADESRLEFGDEAILKCYENMNFAYEMTFLSAERTGWSNGTSI